MSDTGHLNQSDESLQKPLEVCESMDHDGEMMLEQVQENTSNNDKDDSGEVSELTVLEEIKSHGDDEVKSHGDDDFSDIDDDIVEDVEDIWDGEDPSEVEVEKFCLPSESTILEDLNVHLKKKKLIIYPMKLVDFVHPTIIDCIEKCSDFKTTYLQNHDTKSGSSWKGLIELTFKTSFHAMEAIDVIRNIRDDIVVKHYEADEPAMRRTLDRWMNDNANVCSSVPKNVKKMLVVRRLTDDIKSSQLRPYFPSSLDIVISKESLKSQSSDWIPGKSAFVFFNSEEDLKVALDEYSEEGLVVNGNKLKLIPYQPPNFPCGLIKMKRRYRILRQIHELNKTLKDQEMILNESSKSRLKTSIDQCKLTIEKDNRARQELGLPIHRLSYLHKIPAIRDSIPPDFEWLPQISFRTEDADDRHQGRRDNKKRNKKTKRGGSNAWVDNIQRRKDPTPLKSSTYEQIARVHEIAAKIAKIAATIEQRQADKSRGIEFEEKRIRSPENAHPADISSIKPDLIGQDQSRDIRPLMSMHDVGWNNRNQQNFGNPDIPRVESNVNHPAQGYRMNQVPPYDTFNQAVYNPYPPRQQGPPPPPPPPENYYNYAQNYNARYPYAGYGYQPNMPNMWGPNQNQPWNPQMNNYLWQNQP